MTSFAGASRVALLDRCWVCDNQGPHAADIPTPADKSWSTFVPDRRDTACRQTFSRFVTDHISAIERNTFLTFISAPWWTRSFVASDEPTTAQYITAVGSGVTAPF